MAVARRTLRAHQPKSPAPATPKAPTPRLLQMSGRGGVVCMRMSAMANSKSQPTDPEPNRIVNPRFRRAVIQGTSTLVAPIGQFISVDCCRWAAGFLALLLAQPASPGVRIRPSVVLQLHQTASLN